MRILYFSVHEILEYDDLRMFTSAGHEVFSCGIFMRPSKEITEFRQSRPEFFSSVLTNAFDTLGISPEFVDLFDVVLVNHSPRPLIEHEQSLFRRPVIYRSIGQSTPETEAIIQSFSDRIFVVRYSERERTLPGFGRTDAVIYFAKDLADYGDWEGGGPGITFHNDYTARSSESIPHVKDYQEICRGIDTKIYSRKNQDLYNWGGMKSLPEMSLLLRQASSYFYIWSVRASYTLNLIEAMLVGTPVIAPSEQYIEKTMRDDGYANWAIWRYEVCALLADENAMLYNDREEARSYLIAAANSDPAILSMSFRIRTMARRKFDMLAVLADWQNAFGRL